VRVFAAPALASAHMYRIPDEDEIYPVVLDYFRECREIVANPGALKRRKALRGDPERVADGQPNAPFTQVERQNPQWTGESDILRDFCFHRLMPII